MNEKWDETLDRVHTTPSDVDAFAEASIDAARAQAYMFDDPGLGPAATYDTTDNGKLQYVGECPDEELVACSQCGQRFDVGEQVCPCGSRQCEAYKPWMSGCNHPGSCAHRNNCPW